MAPLLWRLIVLGGVLISLEGVRFAHGEEVAPRDDSPQLREPRKEPTRARRDDRDNEGEEEETEEPRAAILRPPTRGGVPLRISAAGFQFATRPDDRTIAGRPVDDPLTTLVSQPVEGRWQGDRYRTENFIVGSESDRQLAKQVAEVAEVVWAREARAWFGREAPRLRDPIRVTARLAKEDDGVYDPNNETIGVWGPREQILKEVVPHEVFHALAQRILGRELPAWADEGVALAVEWPQAHARYDRELRELMRNDRTVSLERLFTIRDAHHDAIRPQGQSVVRFLVALEEAHGADGRRRAMAFIVNGARTGDWAAAARRHYSYESLSEMESAWREWFLAAGRPRAQNRPVPPASIDGVDIASGRARTRAALRIRPTR